MGLGFLGLGLMFSCANAPTNSEAENVDSSALTASAKAEYRSRGMTITKASFQALSGALQSQMKAGGPSAAVDFCNVHASSLVDSLMQEHGVSIRRTSMRYRNPANAPTALERAYLSRFDSIFETGQEPRGEVVYVEGEVHYFQPIFLSDACLKCHGSVRDIGMETQALLEARYPEDRATGFKPGDLRGMWSLAFEEAGPSTREENQKNP